MLTHPRGDSSACGFVRVSCSRGTSALLRCCFSSTVYLSICCLFNDAGSSSGYIAWDGNVIAERKARSRTLSWSEISHRPVHANTSFSCYAPGLNMASSWRSLKTSAVQQCWLNQPLFHFNSPVGGNIFINFSIFWDLSSISVINITSAFTQFFQSVLHQLLTKRTVSGTEPVRSAVKLLACNWELAGRRPGLRRSWLRSLVMLLSPSSWMAEQ